MKSDTLCFLQAHRTWTFAEYVIVFKEQFFSLEIYKTIFYYLHLLDLPHSISIENQQPKLHFYISFKLFFLL
jgi:hypothetical protein